MTYLSKTNFVQILKACGHPHHDFYVYNHGHSQ